MGLMFLINCCGQNFQSDKMLHFTLGYAIGATTTSILEQKLGKRDAILVGFGVATAVGLAKELLYDGLLDRGHSDINDFGVTALGGITGSFIITINF